MCWTGNGVQMLSGYGCSFYCQPSLSYQYARRVIIVIPFSKGYKILIHGESINHILLLKVIVFLAD